MVIKNLTGGGTSWGEKNMVIKNLTGGEGDLVGRKKYVCGSKACLVIIKKGGLMASSTHLISIIFCISLASSFNNI